ncbi:unnamed protein product [Moneuplotes crassus]|uniref:Uncharacterized protein n=1 Tax=Euplotes crassus TaxID=5936 RepID=A0AAD1UNQ8_EUPCR|nr:unnamed protein product [Moneuplotes crassus]
MHITIVNESMSPFCSKSPKPPSSWLKMESLLFLTSLSIVSSGEALFSCKDKESFISGSSNSNSDSFFTSPGESVEMALELLSFMISSSSPVLTRFIPPKEVIMVSRFLTCSCNCLFSAFKTMFSCSICFDRAWIFWSLDSTVSILLALLSRARRADSLFCCLFLAFLYPSGSLSYSKVPYCSTITWLFILLLLLSSLLRGWVIRRSLSCGTTLALLLRFEDSFSASFGTFSRTFFCISAFALFPDNICFYNYCSFTQFVTDFGCTKASLFIAIGSFSYWILYGF